MDKYEYNVRLEQITKLLSEKDYKSAAKISDSVDWRRVRNVSTLTMIGEVYEGARRYEDAKDILLMAYEKAPIGRRLAYRLTEVCIKGGDFKGAKKYYEDFVNLSPNDNRKYELLYEIYKKQGMSAAKRAPILEEYIKSDMDEYWGYELALCYYEAGMNDKCVNQCDELFLWYGEGEYVVKALELKEIIAPLTEEQAAVVRAADEVPAEPVKETASQKKTKTVNKLKRRAAKKNKTHVKTIEEQLEEREQYSVQAAEETKDIRKEQELIKNTISQDESVDTETVSEKAVMAVTDEGADVVAEKSAKEPVAEESHQQTEQIEGQMTIEELLAAYEMIDKTEESVQEESAAEVEESVREMLEEPVQAAVEEPENAGEVEEAVKPEVFEAVTEAEEVYDMSEAVYRATDEMIEEVEKGLYSESVLTDEQRATFKPFLYMRGMEEQLVDIFQSVAEHRPDLYRSADGNILIVGEHKSGKTTLAIDVIKEINSICNRFNRRIAKISGERLNNKGIRETFSQLNDSDLLIEHAGRMSKSTLQGLLQFMSGETGGMRVVFEDTKEAMEYILSQVPETRTYFDYYIELREVEIADWVAVAENYCKESDFIIDDMAKLALSARISQISRESFAIEYEDVKKIADDAMKKYKRRHFFKRKSEDKGMAVLREVDFKQ